MGAERGRGKWPVEVTSWTGKPAMARMPWAGLGCGKTAVWSPAAWPRGLGKARVSGLLHPPPHDCPPARPCGCGSKELDSRAGPRRSNGEPQQDRSAVWGGEGQGPHTPQGGRQRTLDCGRTARSPGSPPRAPVTRGPAGRGGGGAGGAGIHALCSSTRVGCGADGTKRHPEPRPAG